MPSMISFFPKILRKKTHFNKNSTEAIKLQHLNSCYEDKDEGQTECLLESQTVQLNRGSYMSVRREFLIPMKMAENLVGYARIINIVR